MAACGFFENVLIQVSTTPDFSSDVYTVFSTENEITVGGVKVYDGGIVMNDIPEGDVWKSPWIGRWYVNSANEQVREYAFPDTVARYIRVTNQLYADFGPSNTIISDIAAHYAGDTEIVKELAVTEIKEQTVVLPENPTEDVILAALPEKTTLVLSDGSTAEVDLTWASDDWDGKSGTFVASFTLPANTSNAYGLAYTYEIKADEIPSTGDAAEEIPSTGDAFDAAWLLIGMVSACAFVIATANRRKIAG